jgi:hypothetical protein
MVFCQNKTAVLVVEKQENEGYEEEEEEEEDTDADLDTDDDDGEGPISGKILGLLLDLFFPLPSLGCTLRSCMGFFVLSQTLSASTSASSCSQKLVVYLALSYRPFATIPC